MSSRKSIVVWRRALENLQQLGVERAWGGGRTSNQEIADTPLVDRHVAVFIDGHAGAKLEEILRIVTEQSRHRGLKPVIVTIDADLDRIRSYGLPVEIVLDTGRQVIEGLPMHLRLDQQLRGIVRLWQPVGVVAFAHRRHEQLVRRLRELLQEGAKP